VRIVAGRYGGRRLEAPAGRDTRPTGEGVREALFSVLGPAVVGARVADLFAGTGALGLEALSRGAEFVDFFDSGRVAIATLRRNIATLGAEAQTRLITAPLPRGIGMGAAWNLVLLDPPWGQGLGVAAVARLVASGRLAPGALVVAEDRRGAQPPTAAWRELGLSVEDARDYGDTSLVFLRAPEAARPEPEA